MAIDYRELYPGQTLDDPAAYPEGRARDVAVPGDGTGTPFTEAVLNDIWGFHQALTRAASVEVEGTTPDTAEDSDRELALRILTRRVACSVSINAAVADGDNAELVLEDHTGDAPFETDFPVFATVDEDEEEADPGTQLRIPEEPEPFGRLYLVSVSGMASLSSVANPAYASLVLRIGFTEYTFAAVRFSTNPLHPVPFHFQTLAQIDANGEGLVSVRNESGGSVTLAATLVVARVNSGCLHW